MHDYRYNPIDSSEYVNYKPDIVVAAGSTSEGTPMATGIVALMLQLKPSLATHGEEMISHMEICFILERRQYEEIDMRIDCV